MSRAADRVTPVVRLAPAKVNLALAVVGRRPDGFHSLHSVMAPLELADLLSLAPALGSTDDLHVVASGGGLAPDLGPASDNLAIRGIEAARRAVREAGDDRPLPALAVRLEKRIPVAAGLGGGSSDAVAALDGALEAWGVADIVEPVARHDAAARLGSDCPFFAAAGWAHVEGRGERVAPLPPPAGTPPGVLLVTPAGGLSTAAVFEAYAAGARAPGGAALATSRHLAAELRSGLAAARFLERAGVLAVANDLSRAAGELLPGLAAFRRGLARLLGRPVGQSGSGPTLWVLAPTRAAAEADADAVRAALESGGLDAPGGRPPSVIATAFATIAPTTAAGLPAVPS